MKDVLIEMGLGEKEVQIYLALVKLGNSSVDGIKKETKIERTNIYKILERLEDKNFVSSLYENKIKKFSPISPEKLLHNLKNTEEKLKDIIPKLNSLSRKPKEELSNIFVYRGKDGFRKLGEEILSNEKEYLVLGEQGRLEEIFPIYSHQFMKKLEINKIKEKVLVEYGKKVVSSKNTMMKVAPKGIKFPSTTVILEKSVVLVIWSELVAILIESKEVASSYRSQFESLWKISK